MGIEVTAYEECAGALFWKKYTNSVLSEKLKLLFGSITPANYQ